jgi:hypothetical protein
MDGPMSVLDRIEAAGVLAVAVLDEPAGAALGRGFSGDECPDEISARRAACTHGALLVETCVDAYRRYASMERK